MAKLNRQVIEALRTTAKRLQDGAEYQWGHAGACNCGHLAQTVTRRTQREIYSMVNGEWSEHLNDFCPITGQAVEDVAAQMIAFGFTPSELTDLEWLGDPRVLERIPGRRHLRRNDRDDVVLYLQTWAQMLETEPA
jgi:hypothetical protein